jgi:uncharacterized surface protein with fasciclin (FAS1) repeats
MPDIVDIAVGAGSFETLVTAVKLANLVDALKSPGPFTVFSGKYTQADLAKLGVVISLEGSPIPIDCSDGTFEVKNSTVLAADIEADNGIIHVIDRVMLMG